MDLEPVLQFIINRLARGESGDLAILKQLVAKMVGVDPVENMGVSDSQLEAYATGREMIRESLYRTAIAIARPADDATASRKDAPIDKNKSTKKSLPRLVNALRETRLSIPIWVALAQVRLYAADHMLDAPLKAMSVVLSEVSAICLLPTRAYPPVPQHFRPIQRPAGRTTIG